MSKKSKTFNVKDLFKESAKIEEQTITLIKNTKEMIKKDIIPRLNSIVEKYESEDGVLEKEEVLYRDVRFFSNDLIKMIRDYMDNEIFFKISKVPPIFFSGRGGSNYTLFKHIASDRFQLLLLVCIEDIFESDKVLRNRLLDRLIALHDAIIKIDTVDKGEENNDN